LLPRIIRMVLFVICHLSLVSVHALEPENRLEVFLQDLDTYSAAFEQTQLNERGEELEQSVGVVYMRRPGMIHWSYWEPYAQLIISDGITLWIYEEDLEQVIIKDVSNSIENSPAALLGGEVDINEHYIVLEQGVSEDINWMELTPRDIESQYSTVRLGFQNDQLVRMLLLDSLGNQTLIRFLDTKRNTSLKLELFQFTPPEGTDVIDSR